MIKTFQMQQRLDSQATGMETLWRAELERSLAVRTEELEASHEASLKDAAAVAAAERDEAVRQARDELARSEEACRSAREAAAAAAESALREQRLLEEELKAASAEAARVAAAEAEAADRRRRQEVEAAGEERRAAVEAARREAESRARRELREATNRAREEFAVAEARWADEVRRCWTRNRERPDGAVVLVRGIAPNHVFVYFKGRYLSFNFMLGSPQPPVLFSLRDRGCCGCAADAWLCITRPAHPSGATLHKPRNPTPFTAPTSRQPLSGK